MGQGLIPGDREDVMSPKALIPELGVRLVVLGTLVGAVHRGTGTWQAGIRNCTYITHTHALSLARSLSLREAGNVCLDLSSLGLSFLRPPHGQG